MPLWQSVAALHARPSTHLPHFDPPQSTSLSTPFATWSAHVGATHFAAVHTPDAQSRARAHLLPSAHPAAQEPPQSTSASSLFCTRSAQLAAA